MTGDFGHAIKLAGEVLAMRGCIYPATFANATLVAHMVSGSVVRGETNITASKEQIAELALDPAIVEPLPETLTAIAEADLITLGPGSLYTSLITNLLVQGIPEALAAAQGTRIYIANLMTQANESLHLTASEHIERIYTHIGQSVFDYALINTAPVPDSIRDRYAVEGAEAIEARHRAHRSDGYPLHHRQLRCRRRRPPPRSQPRSENRPRNRHWQSRGTVAPGPLWASRSSCRFCEAAQKMGHLCRAAQTSKKSSVKDGDHRPIPEEQTGHSGSWCDLFEGATGRPFPRRP